MNILTIAALLPPLVLLVLIWRVDKMEKEPASLIVKALVLGAASGLVASVVESVLSIPIEAAFGTSGLTYYAVDTFVGVALVEEGVKYLVVMWIVWRHAEFNCRFDGVVYAAAASLGFAMLENVMYVFTMGGLETALLRAFTAIPGHTIFGVFMGMFVGQAKYCKHAGKESAVAPLLVLALVVPIAFHGFYDFLAFASEEADWASVAFFPYLLVSALLACILVVRFAKNDVYIPGLEPQGAPAGVPLAYIKQTPDLAERRFGTGAGTTQTGKRGERGAGIPRIPR